MIDIDTLPDMTQHMYRYRPTHVFFPTNDGVVSVMTFEEAVDLMVDDLIADDDIDMDDETDVGLMGEGYFHSVMDFTLELFVANGREEAERIIRAVM